MCLGSLLNIYIDLIRSISFDKNTGGDHPDISPASPGTFDLHLDTQDFFLYQKTSWTNLLFVPLG